MSFYLLDLRSLPYKYTEVSNFGTPSKLIAQMAGPRLASRKFCLSYLFMLASCNLRFIICLLFMHISFVI